MQEPELSSGGGSEGFSVRSSQDYGRLVGYLEVTAQKTGWQGQLLARPAEVSAYGSWSPEPGTSGAAALFPSITKAAGAAAKL